ncbi:MAG: hypothetical protein BWY63_02669 [Chloroflexi bacterium ADurb.Bin360]|nr:MAG: hypothetical protein BWY63_02669 [Chloroflexi bacterium ADurb.Bin360]
MQQLLRKSVMVFMAMAMAFGVWGWLPVTRVAAATYPENFDTDLNWTCPSGCSTYTGTKTYTTAAYPNVSFAADNALRQTAATQDGFPATHGASTYAWRLNQNTTTTMWQAIVSSGGVGTFSVWVRRWDGTPTPDFTAEYSTDNGATWTTVQTINNTWLDGISDWKQLSGTINTSNGSNNPSDIIIIRIRGNSATSERIMIDDFVMTDYPMAVDLAGFSAVWQGDAVAVTWETAQELDNLGFNLYRGESEAGPWVKLNEALIPTQVPGAVSGAVYEWLDAGVTPGTAYFYRLEDVDIYGLSTFHGPVGTEPAGPSAVSVASFGAHGAAWGLPLMLAAFGLLGVAKRRE